MKLLIVMVTYNRLAYSMRTLQSLLHTITGGYHLVVVDNASTDGTWEWLNEQKFKYGTIHEIVRNAKNYYPGAACNIGWMEGLISYPQADFLMRTDNDIEFFSGWKEGAADYFNKIPRLGQLGLNFEIMPRVPKEHNIVYYFDGPDKGGVQMPVRPTVNGKQIITWPGSIGSPMVIRRSVYDAGIRYDEIPWNHDGKESVTIQEDGKLSTDILRSGWYFGHASDRLALHFGTPEHWVDYPKYYDKTMGERGYTAQIKKDLEKLRGNK